MIKIRNLTKKYAEKEILKDANYTFPQKGLVCLLGPSGCGKSTLLNLIAGFDTDYKGSITVGDNTLSFLNIDELCNYRKDNIGFVFQDYHLLTGYTVLENVLLPCDLVESSYENNVEKANELLDKLGMSFKRNNKIENLSGGQKQRVAIARALIQNPTILLADEPTGALDRKTSNEIMNLLKSISENMLVIVITHDKKVCSFADEIISIEDKNIIGVENKINKEAIEVSNIKDKDIKYNNIKVDTKKRAKKNFKVYMKQFITVAISIALGISSFMLSISSTNVMNNSIEKFKEKNTAFNNGYIKSNDEEIYKVLSEDDRVIDVYYQYKLENISLSINGKNETLPELIPMPKTDESLSYGVMPRKNKGEIAITPSLARKLDKDISNLIGKNITVKVNNYIKELKVSGIYNAGYDSIFISSDIENDIYEKIEHDKDVYSISYDVNSFEDVITINNMLLEKNINSSNASEEVENLINTFRVINKLFLVVSILIFLIGLFVSIILLSKLQNSRVREMGLLAALGFNKKQIKQIILTENMILSIIASATTVAFIGACYVLGNVLSLSINLSAIQIVFSVAITFLIVSIVSVVVSNKLVKIEPAKALRM